MCGTIEASKCKYAETHVCTQTQKGTLGNWQMPLVIKAEFQEHKL